MDEIGAGAKELNKIQVPRRRIEWQEGNLQHDTNALLDLKIFIYLLIRDHLTIGDLSDLLEEAKTTNSAQFSNRTLYRYACEIIERLLEER